MRHRFFAIMAVLLLATSSVSHALYFSNKYKLFQAIKNKKPKEAILLIAQPGGWTLLKQKDPNGNEPLHLVTRKRALEWMALLIRYDAPVDGRDAQGNTSLHLAARQGFAKGVDLLLNEHATVDPKNNTGETPLIQAVQAGHLGVVDLLLRAGADPDHTDQIAGQSARDYAQVNNRSRRFLALIEEHDKRSGAKGSEKSQTPKQSFGPHLGRR